MPTGNNSVSNVTAGKPKVGGSMFRAPAGTELPTNATSELAAAFKCLGYVSEDGVTNAISIDSEDIKAWGGDTVLTPQTGKTDTFQAALLESLNIEALKAYFAPHLGGMCEDCRNRYEKNPMRILDCKVEGCKAVAAGAPRMLDYLCDDCRAHFDRVRSLLTQAGVAHTVDPSIVRGLDYYSRTVFEFVSAAAGAQGTVLGGGRYDTLLEQMDGKAVPAVGFAAGMERLLLVMESEGKLPAPEEGVDCYLAGMDAPSRERAFLLANELRRQGVSCETDLMERSVKAQFKYADKTGARFVAVLGERELLEGAAEVKDMKTSSSERVKLEELANYIQRRRS